MPAESIEHGSRRRNALSIPSRCCGWLGLLVWLSLVGCNGGSAPPPAPTGKEGPTAPGVSWVEEKPAGDSAAGPFTFRDRTAESGITFQYRNGEEAERYAILESMGGGAGLFDYDRDGRFDLLIAGGGGYAGPRELSGHPHGLFRQVAPWRWVACPAALSVPFENTYTHGVATDDFDSDGFPDAAVTGYGRLTLSRNLGDGTFDGSSEEVLQDPSWGTSAAWGDIDRDGDLDLFVSHYVNWSFDNDPPCLIPPPHNRDVCPPRRFDGLADSLFLNDGSGRFTDEAKAWGLRPDGKGIGVVLADVDLDGDLDAYVCNDTVPNFLYMNEGTRLEEAAMVRGVALSDEATADGSMGVDIADFDNDGLPDIWVTNYQRELMALYRNLGDANFQHSSRMLGIATLGPTYVGWGTVFLDPDRDGDEDLVATCGHVVHFPTGTTVAQKPILLENRGGKRFVNVAASAGEDFRRDHPGRGLAAGDLDNDGDPDLVFIPVNENISVVENASGDSKSGLALRLIGTASPRHPVGAIIETRIGTARRVHQIKGGGSYASTNGEELFVGLGESERIDELVIRWPSGRRSVLKEIPGRQRLVVVEPAEDAAVALALP